MRKWIIAFGLIATIVLSLTWAGIAIDGQRPRRPVAGSFHRSKVDSAGHTRGIVQVDLMRKILADRARSAAPGLQAGRSRPTSRTEPGSSPARPPSPADCAPGHRRPNPRPARPARKRAGRGRLLPGRKLHGVRQPLGRARCGAAALLRAGRGGLGRQRRRTRGLAPTALAGSASSRSLCSATRTTPWRRLTGPGSRSPAARPTTARPCTALSSSTATARSAGPTSAIAPSTTSRRCWRNWTGRAEVSANPCRGVSRNGTGVP